MQNIVLDNIKFPTGKEKDGARFRQIQEERLNRNFRRLLENDANKNSATALPDSIRVGDNIDIYKPTVHHEAVLEQFGSTVTSHSASGNYAKVVTFSTDVTVGKNMLDNSHPSAQNTYNIVWGGPMSGGADGSLKLGAGTYTVSASEQMNGIYIADTSVTIYTVYNNTKATFTLTAETSIKVKFYKSTATNMSDYLYQLEAGSEATPYEPYVSTSNINVNAPITLEYAKTGDVSPTTLTIVFNRDYSLASFTKNASADAYLVNSATARWDLYIGKNNSSDSVEILDFHNPWSNTDMTIDWDDTSISTLPTGYVSAVPVNTVLSISPDGVSVPNNTWKTTASITLPRGIWILTGYTQFNSNSTGIRSTVLSESQDSGTSTRNMSSDLNNNTGNNTSKLHFFDVYQVASQVTYYLNAYQNSGSAITTYGRITAIRIV